MNILWITTQFPSKEQPQKGMFIYRTVNKLKDKYIISVLQLNPFAPPIWEIVKRPQNTFSKLKYWLKGVNKKKNTLDFSNINVKTVNFVRPPRNSFEFFEGYLGYKKSISQMQFDNIDLIHANWIFPEGMVALQLKKKFNIPFVISLRGTDVNNLKIGSLNHYFAKKILKEAKYVASVSKDLLNKCTELRLNVPASKKKLVHNFYESEKFIIKDKKEAKKKLNLNKESSMIFFAGGLVKNKNPQLLIEAFAKIKNIDNLNLFIAGTGNEATNLEKSIKLLKLEKNVKLVGSLDMDEIINFYNAADVFCLPSLKEGLPNVVIESLLCGTPAVASAINEIPYIIKNGVNGFLIDEISVDQTAYYLTKALEKSWNREVIRQTVNGFKQEFIMKEYLDLYEKEDK